MLKTLNTRLMASLMDLKANSGDIGCPSFYLNPKGLTTRLECTHVCGVLFPEWKEETVFYRDGCKCGECPCVKHGRPATKKTFWDYIDNLMLDVLTGEEVCYEGKEKETQKVIS